MRGNNAHWLEILCLHVTRELQCLISQGKAGENPGIDGGGAVQHHEPQALLMGPPTNLRNILLSLYNAIPMSTMELEKLITVYNIVPTQILLPKFLNQIFFGNLQTLGYLMPNGLHNA